MESNLNTPINKVEKIDSDLYLIKETESVNCYLLIGSEKALLIDVGYGYEDINPIIKSITDKPLIVALTHGDPDHGLGAANFKEFMIHPLDYGKLLMSEEDGTKAKMLTYRFNKMPELVNYIDFDKYVNHTSVKNSKPIFMTNHEIIDLGNKHVEVYHTPGHSYGHVMFLEKETGRLFTGDQISLHNIWHFLSSDKQAPFSTTLHSLKELRKKKGIIKELYPAHNKYGIGIELIDDLIECLENELAQNYKNDKPFHHSMGDGYQHFYKTVNLIYSDERLSEFLGIEIKR